MSNITSVASATASTQLMAANAGRNGGLIFNESTAVLYLALHATTASTTAYTVQVAPGASFQLPAGYTGPVWGVWASANGSARVTQF